MWHDPFIEGFWLRIGMTVLCGGLIGFERQIRGKPAGIRTSVLICLGTMTFIQLGKGVADETVVDATRVLGQVITGIGFLGAGLMINREGLIKGVTSASVIWLLAGVGAAIGFERYGMALAISLASVTILSIISYSERMFKELRRGVHRSDN